MDAFADLRLCWMDRQDVYANQAIVFLVCKPTCVWLFDILPNIGQTGLINEVDMSILVIPYPGSFALTAFCWCSVYAHVCIAISALLYMYLYLYAV